jgi:LmbE family N-acetylglucosaminyl deacetylase
LGLRPNDYHPDHRNAGIAVQDAAYLVIVPNVTPDTPPLKKNPVFLYMKDHFKKPYPFSKDIAIVIDAVVDQKIAALAAHDSQMFEWLPWVSGVKEKEIPTSKEDRLAWLKKKYAKKTIWDKEELDVLKKWYPNSKNILPKHAEFFEICEYGKQPNTKEIKRLFPMLK